VRAVRLLAALLLLAPAGCARADAFTVEMSGRLRFEPGTLSVPVGSRVVWMGRSSIPHTSTADPDLASDEQHVRLPQGAEPWDSGEVGDGQAWSRIFTQPGTYLYFCQRHEADGMLGIIEVTSD